jgi:hypothetical protein
MESSRSSKEAFAPILASSARTGELPRNEAKAKWNGLLDVDPGHRRAVVTWIKQGCCSSADMATGSVYLAIEAVGGV